MNGSLLNTLQDNAYPAVIQATLASSANLARYDPSGKFIAAGRHDGMALIWDLETRAISRYLEGHVKAIMDIDWSRNSRFVLTCSKDWNVIIWDLASDSDPLDRYATIRFDAPVFSAAFHPKNMYIILALLATGETYIVDLRDEHRGRFELEEPIEANEDDPDSYHRSAMTAARFDPAGRLVFVGTANGQILVFNTRTKMMIARHRITGSGGIRGLAFAKHGRRLITNSSDRILRQFNLSTYPLPPSQDEIVETELEPTLRFSDPITRVAWQEMAYSPDGDWLAGGSADPASHKIYIWDIESDGRFVTALDGGREPLLDIHWHPKAPAIASTTHSGTILLWHSPTTEKWGAFAGGFEEVDENVEYEEREDEFDIEDEAELAQRKTKAEEVDVDVIGSPVGEVSQTPTVNLFLQNIDDDDTQWAEDGIHDEQTKPWKLAILMDDGEGD